MATSIRDIARLADVSPAAVSLALNNRPGISAQTRERIMQVARDAGYPPVKPPKKTRRAAQTLSFIHISRHGPELNRDFDVFIGDYIEGMGREARAEGYQLQVSTYRTTPVDQIIEAVRHEGSQGLVILGTEFAADELEGFASLGGPMVILDNWFGGLPFHFVDMNNDDALRDIVGHLHDRGHSDIGFIDGTLQYAPHNFGLRQRAFRVAMAERRLTVDENTVFGVDSSFHGAREGVLALLRSGRRLPTALVCANDLIACGCLQALQQSGVKVPADVSLVGFDNLPLSAVVDPPLTTFEVPKIRMGRLAIRLLTDQLSAREPTPPVKAVISGRLISRDSVRTLAKGQ